jgi:endonuclease/exonuclease/phosphatase family metal-dependent hydrolase
MRRLATGTVLLLLVLVLAVGCQMLRNSGGAAPGPLPEGALRVVTHNVHYILLNETEGRWSRTGWDRRKPALDAAFKALAPDIAGFQEMESFNGGSESRINLALDWLLAQNPGFAAAAVGDPAAFPSTQPILYRRDRLELRDQGWFFFSETPEVIYSRTFNGSYPAFASWAVFRDRATGRGVTVFNVHFDFRSWENRRRSAELVAEAVRLRLEAGERVVLLGDVNARQGSPTHAILEGAGLRFLPVAGATVHFDRGLNLFGAIDHVAIGPGIHAKGAPMVLRQSFGGIWPSDHYPVAADLVLTPLP